MLYTLTRSGFISQRLRKINTLATMRMILTGQWGTRGSSQRWCSSLQPPGLVGTQDIIGSLMGRLEPGLLLSWVMLRKKSGIDHLEQSSPTPSSPSIRKCARDSWLTRSSLKLQKNVRATTVQFLSKYSKIMRPPPCETTRPSICCSITSNRYQHQPSLSATQHPRLEFPCTLPYLWTWWGWIWLFQMVYYCCFSEH